MKNWLINISIKNKIIAVVILTVMIIISFAFSFLAYKEIKAIEHNLIHNTEALTDMFSNLSDYALEFNQKYNASEALKPLQSYEYVVAGQIITSQDSVFATYNIHKSVIEHHEIPHVAKTILGDDYLHVYKPVIKDNRLLGVVYVRADITELKEQKSDYYKTILLLFVVVIVLAYFLAAMLQKNVSEPLHQLVEVTHHVRETNQYNIALDYKYGDEIGQLYSAFSDLIRQIGQRESERDEALKQLQHSMESFQNITESAFDAILLTNREGKINYWNHAAQKMFGYQAIEVIGETVDVLVPNRLRDRFLESFLRFMKTGEWRFLGKPFNFAALSKRGYEFPIELTINSIGKGSEMDLSFTVRDISQRKQYERSLIEARKKAEESDKLKSAFLANMSHEIRTPMNSIIGFSELLSKPNINDTEKHKFLNYIISSGKSLLNLIDDIIDISKIEAGQLKIAKTSVDINTLMSELFASFYENPKVKNPNFDLVLNRAFKDQSFSLLTDPYRVKQILINLLTNAFKFTDEGRIEFGYRVPNTEFVEFYVSDTGVGIPKDKQQIIFDRFGQIEDTYFKNQGGTGLGLGISKKLTEMLGGRMWVDSDTNQGATFYFILPYTTSSGVRRLPPKKQKNASVGNWKGKTVLIAEDEESNFMFLEELLKPTEISIIHAYNGLEAIELFRNHPEINIVLMDIKMPQMDGYQSTRLIKSMNMSVPVIAQTAYAMADEEQKSYEAGCDGYITKPINFEALLEMMARLM